MLPTSAVASWACHHGDSSHCVEEFQLQVTESEGHKLLNFFFIVETQNSMKTIGTSHLSKQQMRQIDKYFTSIS